MGCHPLMAADEWGASRATGVRAARNGGVCPDEVSFGSLHPPPPIFVFYKSKTGNNSESKSIGHIKSRADWKTLQKDPYLTFRV